MKKTVSRLLALGIIGISVTSISCFAENKFGSDINFNNKYIIQQVSSIKSLPISKSSNIGTINFSYNYDSATLILSGCGEIHSSTLNYIKDYLKCNLQQTLKTLVIENGITKIAYETFKEYAELNRVYIASSVNSIGHAAFSNCRNLNEVGILGEGLKKIGQFAFGYCYLLESINLPNSIDEIGQNAFSCCTSLSSIEIPASLKDIEVGVFTMCRSLNSITIPGSIGRISAFAFADCDALNSVNILNGVKDIGSNAFKNCKISNINLPSSIYNIACNAFEPTVVVSWIDNLSKTHEFCISKDSWIELFSFNGQIKGNIIDPSRLPYLN